MKLQRILFTYTVSFLPCPSATAEAAGLTLPRPREPIPLAASPQAKTKTLISSTTASSTTFIQFINPRKATIYTTITATSYQPRPVFPSSSPQSATVTQVVVSHVRIEGRTTHSNGETTTSVTSYAATVPETWVVSKSRPRSPGVTQNGAPRPLRDGVKAADLPCGACPSSQSEDPVCESARLATGCQGQCVRQAGEDGEEWWCYVMHQRDYVHPEMRMGRACWGEGLRYRQLNTPCLEGDVGMACIPCKGLDGGWGAVNWEGVEAGE